MDEPVFLSRTDLAALSAEARSRTRLRANRNLHAMDDPVHRLFNAVEPGTYVRPHRHLTPPRTETLILVAGELGIVLFDDAGAVTAKERLSASGERFGADLPAGTWHTLVALSPGTVFFETKQGPYVAPAGEDVARWAPAEGKPAAAEMVSAWAELFT